MTGDATGRSRYIQGQVARLEKALPTGQWSIGLIIGEAGLLLWSITGSLGWIEFDDGRVDHYPYRMDAPAYGLMTKRAFRRPLRRMVDHTIAFLG